MFKISLNRDEGGSTEPIAEPQEAEFDDRNGLISSLCEELEASDLLRFEISGFGQEPWFVTVETDLPILLEQLPDVRDDLLSGRAFEIDFYEQGLERKLCFEPKEGEFLVSCISGTNWVPEPSQERVSKEELVGAFQKVREAFLSCLRIEDFQGEAKRWIGEWSMAADFSVE